MNSSSDTRVKKILESLNARNEKGQLPHFFQLKTNCPGAGTAQAKLEDFCTQLLSNTFQLGSYKNLLQATNNPDFLLIRPENSERYTVDDIGALFEFVELRSFGGKTKVTVLADAHKMTEPVANKLLKILEEPPQGNCLFFLNPSQKQLLPTLESRSVTLNLFGEHKGLPSSELASLWPLPKAKISNENELLRNVLQQTSFENWGFEKLEGLINQMRHEQQTQLFHNAQAARMAGIHYSLQEDQ